MRALGRREGDGAGPAAQSPKVCTLSLSFALTCIVLAPGLGCDVFTGNFLLLTLAEHPWCTRMLQGIDSFTLLLLVLLLFSPSILGQRTKG